MASSIDRASEHFGTALAALETVGGNVRVARQLIGLLGWDLPPGVADIGLTDLQVAELAARLDALGELRSQPDPPDVELAAAVAEVLSAAIDALDQIESIADGLQATPGYVEASGIKDELFRRLGDLLVVQMLGTTVPAVVPLGILLGLFEFTHLPADPATFQIEHIRQVVRWDRFATLFDDPSELLREVYGWGTPQFDGELLLLNLGRVAEYFAADVGARPFPREAEEQITGGPLPGEPGAQLFVSVAKGLGFDAHDAGITVYPLQPTAPGAADGGIGISPYVDGTTDRTFPLSDALSLVVSASAELEDGIALVLRGGRDPELITGLLDTPAPGTPSAAFELGLRVAKPEGGRVPLLSTGPLSLDAAAVVAALGVNANGDVDPFVRAAIEDGRLHVAPDRGDGFLASILPADGVTATFATQLRWSRREGLRIDGEAGLRTTLALNRTLGPLRLDTLELVIGADGDELAASAALTATALIGPVAATVQAVGAAAALRFERGNLGPADVGVRFDGPDGVGLAVDAGVVTGGGFLAFDRERGEYAGDVSLRFQGIAVRATGLLTTKGPTFSLLVLVSAEFPPVQLGLGFMLVGVGGLLGINRTVNVEALRAGLKTGALGAVLSPPDPQETGAQRVARLAGLFPVAGGRHVFAPTARIVWGTPTLITIELALVLELPAPVRLVALGRLRALLPSADEAIVKLQVDLLGVIDFDRQEAAVDATLADSRLAQFALTGDMALRMSWGARPSFLLAVGGFHPRFAAPPGFPALERVAVALASGDNPKLRLEAYLALTSNTVQFGARVDLAARAGKFSIAGFLSFDALVTLSPLAFEVDIAAKLAVKVGGKTLLSVSLQLTLSGPRPWRARGRASFSILFFDISFGFDVTIGEAASPELPSPVDVAPLLHVAFADTRSWTAQLPAGAADFVTLRAIEPGTDVLAHPLATLQVRQRLAPLDHTLQRFGERIPTGTRRFRITLATIGPNRATVTPLHDHFAPAQFTDLSDDAKLSAPSFEEMTSGAALGADGYVHGTPVTVALAYEQVVVPREDVTAPARQRVPLPGDVLGTLTATRPEPAPAFALREIA